jgi:ketosteroid isomerase-like protein
MSKIESATRIVLAFQEAFNRHDMEGIMGLMSEDCTFETAGPAPDGAVYSGKKAIHQYVQDFFDTSPQAHLEIEEVFGLGWRCVLRWRCEWVDAVGEKKHIRGVDIFQVQDGLIREGFSYVKGSGDCKP